METVRFNFTDEFNVDVENTELFTMDTPEMKCVVILHVSCKNLDNHFMKQYVFLLKYDGSDENRLYKELYTHLPEIIDNYIDTWSQVFPDYYYNYPDDCSFEDFWDSRRTIEVEQRDLGNGFVMRAITDSNAEFYICECYLWRESEDYLYRTNIGNKDYDYLVQKHYNDNINLLIAEYKRELIIAKVDLSAIDSLDIDYRKGYSLGYKAAFNNRPYKKSLCGPKMGKEFRIEEIGYNDGYIDGWANRMEEESQKTAIRMS